MPERTHKAKWWSPLPEGKVKCRLCPRGCALSEGASGYCAVRRNDGGEMVSVAYGYPVALQIDPIEKKPLLHFMPKTRTFSVGSFGCNLGCAFCQNHHLSRCRYQDWKAYKYYSPELLVELAKRHKCESISFTYNEPTVWAEYVMDCFAIAKKEGLATILVSNSFISLEAAKELYPMADAANIDMKGFSEDFYRQICQANLQPVLDAIEYAKTIGVHVEITNLVIPGKNDAIEIVDSFLDWAGEKLGKDIPIHFTAYHPDYQFSESPRTPIELLEELQRHAIKDRGFPNIHLGNIC